MKITVDTNVLVRAVLQDDPMQGAAAARILKEATLIAVSLPVLCEFVWVLRRGAKLSRAEIAQTIRDLLATDKVAMNRSAVEAGLAMIEPGGDFADGVIAYEGQWLGGEVFISFDHLAVELLMTHGQKASLAG